MTLKSTVFYAGTIDHIFKNLLWATPVGIFQHHKFH